MPGTHQNWQALGAGGLYGPQTMPSNVPVARSELDFIRMGVGRTPSAEYPDGYLGTIRTRRDDKGIPTDTVLDSLKNRLTQRSYQRGVHKGERVDPSDYLYPKELDPERGIRRQARGRQVGSTFLAKRNSPVEELAPARHLVNDGKTDIQTQIPSEINPARRAQVSRLMPNWSV